MKLRKSMLRPSGRIAAVVSIGLAITTVGVLVSGCAKKSSSPLVGVFLALSGPQADFGRTTRDGIELAKDQINGSGGIGGQNLELAIEDDRGDSQEARTVVTKLVDQQGVIAVMGDVASSNSLNAAPVCQERKVPMITPSSTNPEVTKRGDYIFRVCFIDTFQGYVMAKFTSTDLKAKRAAILWDKSSDYSTGLHDVYQKEFVAMGGQIVADITYKQGDPDFSSQLTNIRAANPDVIFLPGYYTEVSLIARKARELGIKVPICGCDGWTSPELIKNAGTALEGCYFSDHYSPESTEPTVQKFVNAFKAKYGHEPNSLAALGYDTTWILAQAMKKADSLDPQKIRDEIARTKDYPGVTGRISLNSDRNAIKPAVVLRIAGDKFKYVTTINPVEITK